jgi:hypothetical protein
MYVLISLLKRRDNREFSKIAPSNGEPLTYHAKHCSLEGYCKLSMCTRMRTLSTYLSNVLMDRETGVSGEIYRAVASSLQTLSHKVIMLYRVHLGYQGFSMAPCVQSAICVKWVYINYSGYTMFVFKFVLLLCLKIMLEAMPG